MAQSKHVKPLSEYLPDAHSEHEIAPFDTATFQLKFNGKGTYRYYSDVAYGKYLAASGNILVGYSNYIHFFWNLFEAKDTFMDSIANGLTTTLPNYFKPDLTKFIK